MLERWNPTVKAFTVLVCVILLSFEYLVSLNLLVLAVCLLLLVFCSRVSLKKIGVILLPACVAAFGLFVMGLYYAQGGSTITQQLAKNLYFTQEKVLTRKAAEAFMAWAIEKQYTKDEILELYVNSIYFGSGYYNVRQASEGYFGKAPAQMTPYECTLLAGVPNAPSAYDPAQNPGLARQRQKKGVEQMVERGCLSAAQAREALTPG